MKKVLAICLTMVMVASMSITALAKGGFVSSPSGNPAPTVEAFKPSNPDCKAGLDITSYSERGDMSEELRTNLEKAYNDIANTDDLTKLNADLAKLAKDKNIDGTKLAVSDLFYLHETGCDNHSGHNGFEVTLGADTLNNFVGLLHMNKNGEWELVSGATVVNDGKSLKFSVDSFSPFAIVVDTSFNGSDGPQTGNNSMIYIYVILMAVSAVALAVILIRNKKKKSR